ncbi:GDNF-inducible zinc finger protein 1-like isoform X2 [Dreissena polymorpha]|uniref:GDNF-inducible zinc finger protein 1-like isoform X2 n=1 Tax=Dreissena polymorpha TaxID=45954 RepID=UPI002264DFF2|nr:GDNF-inducible zinc finger protein 1-like isoform X2 [Dreissena polymorpha]
MRERLPLAVTRKNYHNLKKSSSKLNVCQHNGYKSNPKRGRKMPPSIVPEPDVFIQYKDKGFKTPKEIDIKEVLNDFQKTKTGQNIKQEELLKALQKGPCLPLEDALWFSQSNITEQVEDDLVNNLHANKASPEQVEPCIDANDSETDDVLHSNERTAYVDINTAANEPEPTVQSTLISSDISELKNMTVSSQCDETTQPLDPYFDTIVTVTETDHAGALACETKSAESVVSKGCSVQGSTAGDSAFSDRTEENCKDQLLVKKSDKRKQGNKNKQFSRAAGSKVASKRPAERATRNNNKRVTKTTSTHFMENMENHLIENKATFTVQKKKPQKSPNQQQLPEGIESSNKSDNIVQKPKPKSKQRAERTERSEKTNNRVQTSKQQSKQRNLSMDHDNISDDKSVVPTIYKCEQCDYQSTRRDRLTDHMGRVHGLLSVNCKGAQNRDAFQCDLCEKAFVFGKDLNRHKKVVHAKERFTCTVCEKEYKSKYVFNKHVASHGENYKKDMFRCQVCDREYTTKFSLSNHIKSQHLDMKKTFSCPTCGKTFSGRRSYLMHANAHLGVKPYSCEICGKSFTYDKSLKEHRYLHDAVRHFKCVHCGKAFRQKTCLLVHERVHKKMPAQVCLYCGQTFTQRQSLLRHERIHTGEKPFKCSLCSKAFSEGPLVRKHLLMVHNLDRDTWRQCVIRENREPASHYVSGGTGYQPREPADQVRRRNRATVLPPTARGRPSVIALDIEASSGSSSVSDDSIVMHNPSMKEIHRLQVSMDNSATSDGNPDTISGTDNDYKASAAYGLQDSQSNNAAPEGNDHSSFVTCVAPSIVAGPMQSASENADLNSINGTSQMVQNYLSNLPNNEMFTGFELQTLQDESPFLKRNAGTALVPSSQSLYPPHYNTLSEVNSEPPLRNQVTMEILSSESLSYQLYPSTSHVAETNESKVSQTASQWGFQGYSEHYYYGGQYEPSNL